MRKRPLVLCALVGCRAAAPAEHTPTVEVPSPSPAPTVVASAAPAPAPEPEGPFVFHTGDPATDLGDYAIGYWGPNGLATFDSPASVRQGDVLDNDDPEKFILVGRYGVIEAPTRGGYFVRDFGEGGWAVELDARDATGSGKDVLVIHYSLTDDGAAADWAKWQSAKKEPPEVTSCIHFVLEVWSFRGSQPKRLFAHEYHTWANCCGSEVTVAPPHVESPITFDPPTITVRAARASRADATSFHPRALPDIPGTLTPWGTVRERIYRFQAGAFTLTSEH